MNVIRYMLSRELDFDPGTRYAYSNYGYCVLGRLIEKLSGQTYEEFVREKILAPIGIKQMRIGASLDGKQAPGEVRYYTADDERDNVFPGAPEKVSSAYGGFHLEAMDAHGGWIGSAVDLARFAAALDDPQHSPLLKPETFPPCMRLRHHPFRATTKAHWKVVTTAAAGSFGPWPKWTRELLAQWQPARNDTWLVRRGDGLSWVRCLINVRRTSNCPMSPLTPRCIARQPCREMATRRFVFRLEVIVLKANVRPVVSERVLETSGFTPAR